MLRVVSAMFCLLVLTGCGLPDVGTGRFSRQYSQTFGFSPGDSLYAATGYYKGSPGISGGMYYSGYYKIFVTLTDKSLLYSLEGTVTQVPYTSIESVVFRSGRTFLEEDLVEIKTPRGSTRLFVTDDGISGTSSSEKTTSFYNGILQAMTRARSADERATPSSVPVKAPG